jgi:xylulokinase
MGLNLRWFRDELSEPSKQEGEDRAISPYRILDEKAAQVLPGSGRLLFVPHFSGTRDPWRPNTRGVWFGLGWEHKRENLYRAMLESTAFEYYYYSLLMREHGLQLEEIRVVGGGARSDLWNQIKSDMLNVRYLRLAREEGACLGTAAIAAYAIGLTDDIAKTVCQWTSVEREFQPRRTYHDCYLKYYRVYQRLIRDLNGSFDDLAGLPLTEPSSLAPE